MSELTLKKPADLSGLLSTVHALIEADELDTAIALAEACAAEPGQDAFFAPLGIACARRGLADRAIAAFRAAVAYDPYDIASWTDLAEAQIDKCAYLDAAAALDTACVLDPNAEHPSGKRARVLIAKTRKQLKAAGS